MTLEVNIEPLETTAMVGDLKTNECGIRSVTEDIDTSGSDISCATLPVPPPLPDRFRSFQQFVCLAGVPRAGASLLSAILSQNPRIYAGGTSPMCQMMWDTYLSYQDKCSREFASNGKDHFLPQIISAIPHVFYHDISGAEIVVDNCRSWTQECNLNMLRGSIDPNIKIIVMERPVQEVIESYARLFSQNHMGSALDSVLPQLLNPNTEPILRAMDGINWAKRWSQANPSQTNFLFVAYEDLVTQPATTLQRIYDFCGWITEEHPMLTHDFTNVTVKYPVNETVHGLVGQFRVHPRVEKRVYTGEDAIVLSEEIQGKLRDIDAFFTQPQQVQEPVQEPVQEKEPDITISL